MTSIGSAIAQNPYRANYFVAVGTASALGYSASNVEILTTPTGIVSGATTQVINMNNISNATTLGSANLLLSNADISAAGVLMRDMGRQVHVQVNGVTLYTLAKVQRMTGSASEGVGGDAPAAAGLTGYNTFYVATFSSDPSNAASGGATPPVGVARVGGF